MTAPYDPKARRDTPLALKLKERIRREGPISVGEYMRACLQDPDHGYYRTRQVIGQRGDFITAPEISQVFGELIGLWCAVVWQQMGSPKPFNLVELGPGRGTLMRDALRAARKVPGFLSAAQVALVETSERLKVVQQSHLLNAHPELSWYRRLRDLPRDAPTIVVANELLDALPIDQIIMMESGWQGRTVALGECGNLQFSSRPLTHPDVPVTNTQDRRPGAIGDILSSAGASGALCGDLATLGRDVPIAALFIDYGHVRSAPGDTLQAVRDHRFEDPLTSPGEADLSSQVDFEELVEAVEAGHALTPNTPSRLAVDGPVTQAEFLGALGIVERASRLMAANPARAGEIEIGVARLMAPNGMGSRFKAIGIRSTNAPPLPGFPGLESPVRMR